MGCPTNKFQCRNGECIWAAWVCDKVWSPTACTPAHSLDPALLAYDRRATVSRERTRRRVCVPPSSPVALATSSVSSRAPVSTWPMSVMVTGIAMTVLTRKGDIFFWISLTSNAQVCEQSFQS